jgi:hypothetical protein
MASDLVDCPEASDGDDYNDPDNNDYYREGRGNSACEAVEHCQKLQFMRKVFEMQAGLYIKDIYECILALAGVPCVQAALFKMAGEPQR